MHTHSPNALSFQLEAGGIFWHAVGFDIALHDASTLEHVVADIIQRPQGAKLLVVGYFNADLASPEGHDRDKSIALAMAKKGLEEMAAHFLPRHRLWTRYGRTWRMLRHGQEVISRMDYILGTDRRLLQNVAVRYPRHNTDHYLVLG